MLSILNFLFKHTIGRVVYEIAWVYYFVKARRSAPIEDDPTGYLHEAYDFESEPLSAMSAALSHASRRPYSG